MLTRLRALVHHLNHAKMSTASYTVHNPNVACCTIPPVKSDYTPKGSFTSYGGFRKVYVTGPQELGDTALVCVYDIFGFKPQTQQGADIIADQLKVKVLMPDFFEDGEPWPAEHFPPKTPAEKRKLQDFFGGIASPPANKDKLIHFGRALKNDNVNFVGVYGFCWGGKVIMLAGGEHNTPFGAVSIVHPAMLSAADAAKLKVPLGIYPSNDESEEEYEKIIQILKKKPFADKSDWKHFDSFHGFAAARANLDDPDNKAKYEDLYCTVIKFFGKA
ncbi:unnamed protein product [Somion occarium]|uniref:Dienelactone hydrolase domain-containing protein n=1 Tax=Somion occarium TaxID=3059160 RepID=A0ABP1CNC9_9APHY